MLAGTDKTIIAVSLMGKANHLNAEMFRVRVRNSLNYFVWKHYNAVRATPL